MAASDMSLAISKRIREVTSKRKSSQPVRPPTATPIHSSRPVWLVASAKLNPCQTAPVPSDERFGLLPGQKETPLPK